MGIQVVGGGGSGSGSFLAGMPVTVPLLGQPVANFSVGTTLTRYHRVFGSGTISKIGIGHITTSQGNIAVAVYRNSGSGRAAIPTTRAATSGLIASPGTGYRELSLGASVSVSDGDWFAFANDDAGFVVQATSSSDSATAIADGVRWYENVVTPPATAGTLVSTNLTVPFLIGVP